MSVLQNQVRMLSEHNSDGTHNAAALTTFKTLLGGGPPVIINQDAAGGTGCPADTNENDLKTYTMPGGTLATDGDLIRITATYRAAGNVTTKRIRLYFGASVIADSGIQALNSINFNLMGYVSRTSATGQYAQTLVCGCSTHTNWLTTNLTGDCYFPSAPTETLSGNVIIKSTIQLGIGAALNDIIQDVFIVEYLKKP